MGNGERRRREAGNGNIQATGSCADAGGCVAGAGTGTGRRAGRKPALLDDGRAGASGSGALGLGAGPAGAGAAGRVDLRPARPDRARPAHSAGPHGAVPRAGAADHPDLVHSHHHRAELPAQRPGHPADASERGAGQLRSLSDLLRDAAGAGAGQRARPPALPERRHRLRGRRGRHRRAGARVHVPADAREGPGTLRGDGSPPQARQARGRALLRADAQLHHQRAEVRLPARLRAVCALPDH